MLKTSCLGRIVPTCPSALFVDPSKPELIFGSGSSCSPGQIDVVFTNIVPLPLPGRSLSRFFLTSSVAGDTPVRSERTWYSLFTLAIARSCELICHVSCNGSEGWLTAIHAGWRVTPGLFGETIVSSHMRDFSSPTCTRRVIVMQSGSSLAIFSPFMTTHWTRQYTYFLLSQRQTSHSLLQCLVPMSVTVESVGH